MSSISNIQIALFENGDSFNWNFGNRDCIEITISCLKADVLFTSFIQRLSCLVNDVIMSIHSYNQTYTTNLYCMTLNKILVSSYMTGISKEFGLKSIWSQKCCLYIALLPIWFSAGLIFSSYTAHSFKLQKPFNHHYPLW